MKETDLFEPVRDYLEQNGYSVSAEVNHCDIVATKNDELVIVELKTSANMQLLIQATDRQRLTESVYVAIPDPGRNRRFLGVQRVLKRLELGLIVVSDRPLGMQVSKLFDPLPHQRRRNNRRRRSIIEEVAQRSANYNVAGSTRTRIVTAYRENAVFVATCLDQTGPASPSQLRALGTGERTTSILSSNHYGWFQRIDRGIYQITAKGREALGEYPTLHERSLQLYRDAKQSQS